MNWINTVNTTSLRIIATIVLMFVAVIGLLVGLIGFNWLPTEQQITVLKGVGLLLFGALGLDVTQFGFKRFSDAGYAAAKNAGAPQVIVQPPSTVKVEGDAVTHEEPPHPTEPAPPMPESGTLTRSD